MKFVRPDIGGAVLASALLLSSCGMQSDKDLIQSANEYLAKRDEKAAIVQLKTLLQKSPESGEGRYLLGMALLKTGNATGAVAELERARTLKFDEAKVLPALAKTWIAVGQAKKVSDELGQVELVDGKAAAELRAAVATALVAQKKVPEAEAAVGAALQFDSRNMTARLLNARLSAGRGSYDDALTLVDGIIQDEPGDAKAWVLKGEILWGGRGDEKGGTDAFQKALAIDPRQIPAHEALINLALQKRDVASLKTHVMALQQAFPESFTARFYGVQLLLAEDNLKGANEAVQRLLKGAPDFPPVLQLAGAVALRNGALLVAESQLKKAVQLAPELSLPRRLLAETYLRSGQASKALLSLQPLLDSGRLGSDAAALAAQAFVMSGNVAKAEEYFALAAKQNPADLKVRTALALTRLANGSSGTAFAELESLASSGPTSYADLALISSRVRRGEWSAALKAIDRLQEKAKTDPLPHLLRGRILFVRKDLLGARSSFEKALSLNPAYFPAVSELAAVDLMEGRADKAATRFEEVLARDPKNYRAILALADLKQGAHERPEVVGALLADGVRLNPEEPEVRLALIDFSIRERDAKTAMSQAQEAVALMPDNIQLLDALGRAQLAAGDVEQAISSFGKILTTHPNLAQPYTRLADAYLIRRDYSSATQNLRRAIELSPNLLPAYRGLMHIALLNKQPDEALKVAKSYQKLQPAAAGGYVLEADACLSQRKFECSIGALKAAMERNPSTDLATRLLMVYMAAGKIAERDKLVAAWERDHPRDVAFLLHVASMVMEARDYAGALARYRTVLGIQPDNGIALNNVAWLMVQQGSSGAVEFAERAVKLFPGRAAYFDTLAAALALDKKLKQAVEQQRKAVELSPEVPGYRLSLAKYLIAVDDKSQARAELERLSKLGDKFASQGEVVALLKAL